jgi:hypothetical protein
MATFLDISGLSFFSSIFTFLLIFIVIYALLAWGKVLGSNSGIHALIAISLAVLFMFSKDAISLVNYVVPWFTIMFIFILLILMAYALFNPEGGGMLKMLLDSGGHKTVVYWIISLAVIIILLGLGNTYGQKVGPYLDENGNTVNSIDYSLSGENGTNIASGTSDNLRGTGQVDSGNFQTNLGATIFHPKMLGIFFILLLGTFTILLITKVS